MEGKDFNVLQQDHVKKLTPGLCCHELVVYSDFGIAAILPFLSPSLSLLVIWLFLLLVGHFLCLLPVSLNPGGESCVKILVDNELSSEILRPAGRSPTTKLLNLCWLCWTRSHCRVRSLTLFCFLSFLCDLFYCLFSRNILSIFPGPVSTVGVFPHSCLIHWPRPHVLHLCAII